MEILNNIDVTIFQNRVTDALINNIAKHTCLALANILAIDYVIRLNSTPEATIYINKPIRRLQNFLNQKVITDDSFSTVLMLFAVAITPETTDYQDRGDILAKSEDIIIDTLINLRFSKTLPEERTILKQLLKSLLVAKNSYELINFMQVEPEIFNATVMHSLKKYQNLKKASAYVKQEINEIIHVMAKHNKKIEIFKQATSKIITAICTLAIGAITVATAGAAFALVVVPVSIFAVQHAPKLGEKIGEMILNADKFIAIEEQKITILKNTVQNNNTEFLSKQQSVGQQIIQDNLTNNREQREEILSTPKLSALKSQVKDHLVNDNISNTQSLQKNKSQTIRQRY
jgi:hypothetical protein